MMTKYSDIVVESSSDDESVRLHNISGRDRRFHIDSSDDDDDDLSEIKSKRGCITCSYRSIEKNKSEKRKLNTSNKDGMDYNAIFVKDSCAMSVSERYTLKLRRKKNHSIVIVRNI